MNPKDYQLIGRALREACSIEVEANARATASYGAHAVMLAAKEISKALAIDDSSFDADGFLASIAQPSRSDRTATSEQPPARKPSRDIGRMSERAVRANGKAAQLHKDRAVNASAAVTRSARQVAQHDGHLGW